jgi:hypothetical protein
MHFVHIRNDVEFPTKQLARYMEKPGKKHLKVADRAIAYLYTLHICTHEINAKNVDSKKLLR